MKCKHGLTEGTCALCRGDKPTTSDNSGMRGRDNLVQIFRGSFTDDTAFKRAKESAWFYKRADDFYEEKR